MELSINDKFSSLQDLLLAIKKHEDATKMTYWRRDTRTLQNAQKRGVQITDNPRIKFHTMKWTCSYGGSQYKSRGNGIRTNIK